MKRLIILGIVICAGTLCTHLSAQVIEGKVTISDTTSSCILKTISFVK